MEQHQTIEAEFPQLRSAYLLVKDFLEAESWEKVTSLQTRLAEDLLLYGDDN